MKILIVEDDQFYAQSLKELLSDKGYSVKVTNDINKVLTSKLNQFPIIIIDVMLPNDPQITGISNSEAREGFNTGVALVRRLKAKYSKIKFILISGEPFPDCASKKWAESQNIPFISKNEKLEELFTAIGGSKRKPKLKVFIVHGHANHTVTRLKKFFVSDLKWAKPLVLRDQQNCGKTIIEKFENYASKVDYVFVVLTPDEKVETKKNDADKRKARQNVIFELGFFYGFFGRIKGKVIILKKGEIELPSDIDGVIWIDISKGFKNIKENIEREILTKHET